METKCRRHGETWSDYVVYTEKLEGTMELTQNGNLLSKNERVTTKMTQWVKCLLCKHALSSDPRLHVNTGAAVHVYNPSTGWEGNKDRQIPSPHWPGSLAKSKH